MDPYRDPPGAPYREAGRPGSPCPRCEVGLAATNPAGVRLDACARCLGVFIAPEPLLSLLEQRDAIEELRALLPRTRSPLADAGPMYVKCPQCTVLMNRTQYAHGAKVVIDYCRRHGTWFDAGELPLVLDFVAEGGHRRAQAWAAQQTRDAERDFKMKQTFAVARARWEVTRVGRSPDVAAFFADLFF
jgi:Zn-finger nucleic acid-binding protein